MEFDENGKWNCVDCGIEIDKDDYVALEVCGPCYHERIWGNSKE